MREDDDYFTCITKAFETLGNPVRRRAFDSVDPLFDDAVPAVLPREKEADFLAVFGPVFARNARWSNKTPVPLLGRWPPLNLVALGLHRIFKASWLWV